MQNLSPKLMIVIVLQNDCVIIFYLLVEEAALKSTTLALKRLILDLKTGIIYEVMTSSCNSWHK